MKHKNIFGRNTLGKRLRDARVAKGLSQLAAAEALKIDKTTVSKWENGTRTPGLRMLRKIVELYGVTFNALLAEPAPSPEHGPDKNCI